MINPLRYKSDIQLAIACLLVLVGCGLLIAGFIVAPTGKIDSSVLTGFGEACTFAGALFGVDYTYRYKVSKIDNLYNSKQSKDGETS